MSTQNRDVKRKYYSYLIIDYDGRPLALKVKAKKLWYALGGMCSTYPQISSLNSVCLIATCKLSLNLPNTGIQTADILS